MGREPLPSGYVVIPRQHETVSYTPTGANGLSFRAKYGAVGLTIVREEFIAEGINEAGLSAGLFYFPHYGKYPAYDSTRNDRTLSDLQYVAWILSQFSSVDEVKAATQTVRVVSIDPSVGSTVHWRIADATGKQVVLEFIDGRAPLLRQRSRRADELARLSVADNQSEQLRESASGKRRSATDRKRPDIPLRRRLRISGYPGRRHPALSFRPDRVLQSDRPGMRDGTRCGIAELPYSEQLRHSDRNRAPRRPCSRHTERDAVDLGDRSGEPQTLLQNVVQQLDPRIDLKKIDFARIGYQAHPLDTIQQQPIEELSIS